jgi:hypothetical protein
VEAPAYGWSLVWTAHDRAIDAIAGSQARTAPVSTTARSGERQVAAVAANELDRTFVGASSQSHCRRLHRLVRVKGAPSMEGSVGLFAPQRVVPQLRFLQLYNFCLRNRLNYTLHQVIMAGYQFVDIGRLIHYTETLVFYRAISPRPWRLKPRYHLIKRGSKAIDQGTR